MKNEKRSYTQTRRAEKAAETRQRIVEAAVDLHREVGPARTTIAMLAERAGVQRHTVYAHFPDERTLFMACSGHFAEAHPRPDPEPWRAIVDAGERLRTALSLLYDYYDENERMTASVLRDRDLNETLNEVSALRAGPVLAAYREILGAGLNTKGQAMLHLALSFYTWRTLVCEGGLSARAAAQAMAAAVLAA